MPVGPRTRFTRSNGPTAVDGARAVDRYLRALDGSVAPGGVAFAVIERDFVDAAKTFARLRGISYDAWRDVGVPEAVLVRAGIALEVVPG